MHSQGEGHMKLKPLPLLHLCARKCNFSALTTIARPNSPPINGLFQVTFVIVPPRRNNFVAVVDTKGWVGN